MSDVQRRFTEFGYECVAPHPERADLKCIFPYGHGTHFDGAEHVWLAPTVADDMALTAAETRGIAEGRRLAVEAIEAHADQWAPKDGNEVQLRMRRHLHTAARVAAGPVTAEQAAQAINEWAAARIAAGEATP